MPTLQMELERACAELVAASESQRKDDKGSTLRLHESIARIHAVTFRIGTLTTMDCDRLVKRQREISQELKTKYAYPKGH